jgi:hypothetical protein
MTEQQEQQHEQQQSSHRLSAGETVGDEPMFLPSNGRQGGRTEEEEEDQLIDESESYDDDDDDANSMKGEEEDDESGPSRSSSSSLMWTSAKLVASVLLLVSAYQYKVASTELSASSDGTATGIFGGNIMSRRLQAVGDSVPSYTESLFKDLAARKKLFDDTPPEEVKYWFEYAGPLQVRHPNGWNGLFCCLGRAR